MVRHRGLYGTAIEVYLLNLSRFVWILSMFAWHNGQQFACWRVHNASYSGPLMMLTFFDDFQSAKREKHQQFPDQT